MDRSTMWYIHTQWGYCSAVRRVKLHAPSGFQSVACCGIPSRWHSPEDGAMGMESGCQGSGLGRGGEVIAEEQERISGRCYICSVYTDLHGWHVVCAPGCVYLNLHPAEWRMRRWSLWVGISALMRGGRDPRAPSLWQVRTK